MQAEAPAEEKVPAAQFGHAAAFSAAYVPAAQVLQPEAPELGWNAPAEHTVQAAAAAAEKEPAGQLGQADAPEAEAVPAPHAVHPLAPN